MAVSGSKDRLIIIKTGDTFGVAGTSRHGLHKPVEAHVPQGFHDKTER